VQPMKPIRIIVADDHSTWLATTLEWLAASGEFQIEACAINGAEAVELCRQLRPDVALLDISMPVMNGLEAARLIREEGTAALILLMSINQRPEYQAAARAAGTRELLAKHRLRFELIPAIRKWLPGPAALRSAAGKGPSEQNVVNRRWMGDLGLT
jgi:DNA-binding NarL/FixJ family response regulator